MREDEFAENEKQTVLSSDEELAEVNFAQTKSHAKQDTERFSDFMSNIGVDGADGLLAQLSSEFGKDKVSQLVNDPTIYESLAQIYEDDIDTMFAETSSESASASGSESGSESGSDSGLGMLA